LGALYFTIRVLQETSIPWKACLKNAQNYDTEVSQALEAILKNGPRSLTKGLEDWNLEDGLILISMFLRMISCDEILSKHTMKA